MMEKPNSTVPGPEELDRMYTEMLTRPVEMSDDELKLVYGGLGGYHSHHSHHSHYSHYNHRSHHSHRGYRR